ncbi:hypothetical protein DFH07DRAFT_11176 [Mycena maculata]|uniref:Uncharacterized protein n=1 Tax=Mycena maculata TaxID=230809 RepID=A0AAD7NW55_9AGAR|nr:hypothetical protein DFH07DRAFT_11176 [Mycena maculata]
MQSRVTMKLKATYAQITLNKITVVFFLFSLIHFLAQGVVQSFLFSLDSEFAGMVTKIVGAAQIPPQNITWLEGSSGRYVLRMCDHIPYGPAVSSCMVIFPSGVDGSNGSDADTTSSLAIVQDLTAGFSITTVFDTLGSVSEVKLDSTAAPSVGLVLQCTQILVYPEQVLKNSVREDVAAVFLQFWLFGVSVFAVGQSSVPHTLTALGTRILITSWSAYIVAFRTNNQETIFRQVVSAPGTPCGMDLFPTYFGMRMAYDIADLVLSCTGLLLSGLLSWKLLKIYNAQLFRRVGAPPHINRMCKLFMAVQACLQLEVFVLMAATGLWIDLLYATSIRNLSSHTNIYDALIISTTILVLPWIALGWYGVKEERKLLMICFLGIASYFIGGWFAMFDSKVYRWSFVQWPYLACFTVASYILILASAILGAICWRNFGKGLAQYLYAEAALASSNFTPEVFDHMDEKSGNYYTYAPEYPLPTFQSSSMPLRQRSESGVVVNDTLQMPGPLRGPPPVYDRPYNAPV